MPTIQVTGLTEIKQRMAQFPAEYDRASEVAMKASLLTLQENVPSYPTPPANSTYRRTGQLGRSIGSGMQGGVMGNPSIFKAEKVGGNWQGEFGTNLTYAGYVIGEQQARQNKHWWNIKTILTAAKPKIEQVWNLAAEKMAKFLDGK